MNRRCVLLAALVASLGLMGWLPLRAAGVTLSYGGLRACYQTGRPIPPFTITAQVATSDTYRITHAVAVNQQPPGTSTIVYEGGISPAQPKVATVTGGHATVSGTYTLIGSLYQLSTGVLVAQTSATVLVADPCPTPPGSPAPPSAAMADIHWSQTATPSQGARVGSLLTVWAKGRNVGQGSGSSDAILAYDPALLRLLDVTPQRDGDWVRSRDDEQGTITLALGSLAPGEASRLPIRFLVLRAAPETVLTLVRADGEDRANPLFLELGQEITGPLRFTMTATAAGSEIRGRGYKPGERLALWTNRQGGPPRAIEGRFAAQADPDGTVAITLPPLGEDVTSVVVAGQTSEVVGLAILPSP
ncbi:MAG TPA: hypothetical protein VFZ66_23370 [Herpetosiphonaceae bacterium]